MTDDKMREIYQGALRRARGADCPSVDRIAAMVRREGSEPDRLALVNHVMACAGCLEEFELLRSLERAEPARPAATRPAVPRWLALAAGIALVVSTGLVMRALRPGAEDVVRGSAVTLVAPGPALTVGPRPTLVWRSVAGARGYEVTVFGADGRERLRTTTPDTTLGTTLDDPGAELVWTVAADLGADGLVRSRPGRFTLQR